MEELKEVFKEKNFDEFTLNLINNFLYEFGEVFGKYVSKEELIRRIKNNLNHSVSFVNEDDKKRSGVYNKDDKKITLLEGMNEEMLKSVFFHEMIHCITAHEDFVGFGIEYDNEYNGNKKTIVTAKGLTEGFTQLATKKRNQRFGIKADSYPILTEQVENIVELMGEEQFFDMAFNNPLGLEEAMINANIVQYYGEVEPLLQQFNIIWKYEKEIYEQRDYGKSGEERILNAILKFSQQKNFAVEEAKNHIVVTLLERYENMEISTVEELIDLYNKTTKYAKQLDVQNASNIYSNFFTKFYELEDSGMEREEILDSLPDGIRLFTENQFKYEEFIRLSPEEMLKRIAENPTEIDQGFLNSRLADDYASGIVYKIFPGFSDRDYAIDFASILIKGFAKTIIDKGYNIDLLSFDFIKFGKVGDVAFNMYENDGEQVSYIGTFANMSSKCDLEEYKTCSEEERKGILTERGLSSEQLVLVSPSGCQIIYSGNDEYSLIDDENFLYKNSGNTIYFGSHIEFLQEKLQKEGMRYQQLLKFKAPKIVLDDNLNKFQKTKKAIEEKRGRKKFTPHDIEIATLDGEVSLEDIETILEEFKIVDVNREEIFKKGIGYNE